jgi:drug/metabolite transporter (DMT)-like permease
MRPGDYARLLLLAAIWGSAYGFIRVTAPALGAVWTAEGRLVIGAAVLIAWFRWRGIQVSWRHARFYALIGAIGTAIPFTLLAFGGMYVPASVMAVLGATAPMMVLLLSAAYGLERLTARRALGMLLGFVGVWLLSDPGATGVDASGWQFHLAIAACLATAFAYAVTALVVRHFGAGVPSPGLALGTQVFGGIYLAPVLPVATLPGPLTPTVWANLAGLGILASGLAYVLYFRLIKDVGATRTQTVAFVVPLFGMLWGMAFLGESMSAGALLGALSILGGVILVTFGGRR